MHEWHTYVSFRETEKKNSSYSNTSVPLSTISIYVAILDHISQIHLKCIQREIVNGHSGRQCAELEEMARSFGGDSFGQKLRQKCIHLHSFPLILSISTQSHLLHLYHYVPLGIWLPADYTFETISIEDIVSSVFRTFLLFHISAMLELKRYFFNLWGKKWISDSNIAFKLFYKWIFFYACNQTSIIDYNFSF